MSSSFVNRLLRASLVLPQGNFPGTNSNTLVLPAPGAPIGFRMSAKLTGSANLSNLLTLDIYGMRQVDMNAVTVLFGQDGNPQNVAALALVILEANDGTGWLQVFEGQFQEAQPDYDEMPDVRLRILAWTGAGRQWLRASPSSFPGAVNAATLAEQLATQMGFAFENNGASATLSTPYLSGTLMDQFRQLCEDARFDYYFDAKSTLIICPRNQPRQNRQTVVLSPDTGLIGYPKLQRFGIQVKCLFSPAIELGSPIQIQDSQVPGTDGLWFPQAADHELESLKPGGAWFSSLMCLRHPAAAPAGSSST